jgi:hypothetical protein
LRREHPTANPIIVGGDGNSLRMLFDERRALSPEELMDYRERSLRGDGWSLHLAYERDLHDRQQRRLKELNAPEILIRNWEPPEAVNVAEVVNQTWPEALFRPIDLTCAASSDVVLPPREATKPRTLSRSLRVQNPKSRTTFIFRATQRVQTVSITPDTRLAYSEKRVSGGSSP